MMKPVSHTHVQWLHFYRHFGNSCIDVPCGSYCPCFCLTHWSRVTQKCVSKLTNTDSNNGLSPGWCEALIWTTAAILLIGSKFSEILIEIHTFSFKKMNLQMSSRNGCDFVNVLEWVLFQLSNEETVSSIKSAQHHFAYIWILSTKT